MLYTMDSLQLTQLLAQYEYGQFNVVDTQISCNPYTKQIKFSPLYRHGSKLTQGSCGELMNAAYFEIREKYPSVHITRALGTEPTFFKSPGSRHYFLLASDGDLMDGEDYVSWPGEIEEVVAQNPFVVDPCFQKVVSFSDSGYQIKQLFNQGSKVYHSNVAVFPNKSGLPLAVDSLGRLVCLGADFNFFPALTIGVHNPVNDMYLTYGLNSTTLEDLFKEEPKILSCIDILRQKEIVRTTEDFRVVGDIVVE